MAITSVGVGSGLELEDLLTKIIDAERTPASNRIKLKEAQVTASISALGSLKSTLADFQSALTKLRNPDFFNAKSATSSDSTLFTATAQAGADLSSYAIEVIQMAKAHKVASANFANANATVGSGKLTIGVGSNSFDIDVAAGDSVAKIRDTINAVPNSGVRASLLTVSDGNGGTATKLVLTATQGGTANAITVSAADDDGDNTDAAGLSALVSGNLTEIDAAQNGIITIDGFEVTSSNNTFADAISGVSITILKEPTDAATPLTGRLTVGGDRSAGKAAVEGFVANYNALITVLNQLTNYDSSTQTRGLMSGDSSISAIESKIRQVLSESVSGGAAGMDNLAMLGISTNRDGSLKLDDTKLSAALKDRYTDVGTLFSGDNGVAGKLDKLITGYLAKDGLFASREESLQNQQRSIEDQKDKLEARLQKIEARYRSQFSALDILVGQLNQTGNFLQQQLDAAAKIGTSK